MVSGGMISSDATRRRCVTGAAWAALAALLACPIALGSGRGNDVPTYAGEIASILHGRCASCHRPLGAGPFDLLTYEDARKRANQIVDVISSGYMPPWQPDPPEEPTGFEFVGSRRMPDDEIEMIRAWARNDTPRGKKSAEPPPPEFEDGWLLGAPDLVVEVGDGYVLPAEGGDVIRNFVTAIPVEARRWVKTVELRPGNQRVVHHAVLSVDRSRVSRQLDARDPEPGFGGLDMGFAGLPGGHTVIWAPGSVPDPGIDEMAWALDPGGDLVLQLHMVPTGKDETVGMKVGFHFATRPPTIQAVQLMLRNDLIDIPAGLDDYVLQDSLELPVAVDLLAVCPHAHYLGKRIES